MKKNLFKWMMAVAIVASPMIFTACGSDDDDTSVSPVTNTGVTYNQMFCHPQPMLKVMLRQRKRC